MKEPIRLKLFDFQAKASSWTNLVPGALTDPFFFEAAHYWNEDVLRFLFTSPDLDDDGDDDDEISGWQPVRPLGQGGFGLVGLWQKVDNVGNVLDSIAIKQQRYRDNKHTQAQLTVGTSGLASEAALMAELNEIQNRNIIVLRGFKNNEPEKLWRFYFEFAPWGDLNILRNNYRAWNTFFPEEFLWHVFRALANAALDLSLGPFREYETLTLAPEGEAFVLHFDLKPANIFLGGPINEVDADFSNYPVIKMADFGLARVMHVQDPNNPSAFRHVGTSGYFPPEQAGTTVDWRRRPEGKDYRSARWQNAPLLRGLEFADREPGYRFTPAHNTWVIGKIMWELMTLRDGNVLNTQIERLTEHDYWGPMGQEAIPEIKTDCIPEYSPELRTLIRHCLRIAPSRRPTPPDLYNATEDQAVLRSSAASDPATDVKNGRRVYYMGNEINDMPVGPIGSSRRPIPYSKREFRMFNKGRFKDPKLESLNNGRWQPPRPGFDPNTLRVVVGGRKRDPGRKAFVFMRAKYDRWGLVKKIASAEDSSDAEGEHDGHQTDDEDEEEEEEEEEEEDEKQAEEEQGEKEEDGQDGQQGTSSYGEDRNDRGEGLSKKDGDKVTGVTKKRRSAERADEDGPTAAPLAKRPRKDTPSQRIDHPSTREQAGDSTRSNWIRIAHSPVRRDLHDHALENLAAKALADYLEIRDTPSRSPTRPGYSQKCLPGQEPVGYGLTNTSSLPRPPPPPPSPPGPPRPSSSLQAPTPHHPSREAGEGNLQHRGRDGNATVQSQTGSTSNSSHQHQHHQHHQQRPPFPHHPVPRRQDQEITQQNLPALQTHSVGGRALRPRRR